VILDSCQTIAEMAESTALKYFDYYQSVLALMSTAEFFELQSLKKKIKTISKKRILHYCGPFIDSDVQQKVSKNYAQLKKPEIYIHRVNTKSKKLF